VNGSCKEFADKSVGLPEGLQPRFFSGLTQAELSSILSAATHRQFHRFSVILERDEPAERLFLLTRGQGRQFVITSGGQKVILHWLTAGQFFGGVTILSAPSRYLVSTEVESGSCAFVWDRNTMRQFVSRFPLLLENALSIAVTEHIAWAVSARVSLMSDDARGRIANLLLSLACAIGKVGPDGVEIRVGNEDLAAGANVTPFTVSRTLRTWQLEGILTKGRGKLLLRKPELLIESG
jgi:CRP/FNR family transcriptional regulator, nitrogen oxide reductase regulator